MNEKQAELEWEARAGRPAAYAAFAAAALIVAALVYRVAVLPHGASNVKEFLPDVHAHQSAFVVSGIITGLAMLALIPPLLYLYRVTRFRRPELPPVARILIIAAPILYAICTVWYQFRQGHAADQFVNGTIKTNKHAESVLRDATTLVSGLSFAASIGSGLGTILISLNAMRAGLLSRFMGALGVILGALFVLPLIASPIIQLFWLLALGMLYLGKWPGGGRGPAWETGEAVPWPSAQRRLGPAPAEGEEPEPSAPELEEPAAKPNPRASRKRKKKARR